MLLNVLFFVGFGVMQDDFCLFCAFFQCFWQKQSMLQQQQQAGSELNVYLDDILHERGNDVCMYTNICIL